MTASDAPAVVFFDLGDTLGTPVLSPPPYHLVGFNVFPFAQSVLGELQRRGLRLGVISNTGDDGGPAVNEVLRAAGLLTYFDPSLLIYSKDVGLTKDSPEIFRRAAERAGFADAPSRCLFVGEDAKERGFALDAGWRVAPHPLLVSEVLAGQQLQYIRITVPARDVGSNWRDALRALPLVPLHVTGSQGTTVYAVTSLRVVPTIMNMRFELELLGAADAPLRTDLYILRDDAAAASGFLSTRGESARFFASNDDARLVLSSTAEGLVVALPPERSLEEFHFDDARHGHTIKLLPDPSLLEPFRADDPAIAGMDKAVGCSVRTIGPHPPGIPGARANDRRGPAGPGRTLWRQASDVGGSPGRDRQPAYFPCRKRGRDEVRRPRVSICRPGKIDCAAAQVHARRPAIVQRRSGTGRRVAGIGTRDGPPRFHGGLQHPVRCRS